MVRHHNYNVSGVSGVSVVSLIHLIQLFILMTFLYSSIICSILLFYLENIQLNKNERVFLFLVNIVVPLIGLLFQSVVRNKKFISFFGMVFGISNLFFLPQVLDKYTLFLQKSKSNAMHKFFPLLYMFYYLTILTALASSCLLTYLLSKR